MKAKKKKELEKIAELIHAVYKVHCEAIGDYTLSAWSFATEDYKESCITEVVNAYETKLRLGDSFKYEPQDCHAIWMEDKLSKGWKWWSIKNEILKMHPCLVPYESLAEIQKMRSVLFCAAINALL